MTQSSSQRHPYLGRVPQLAKLFPLGSERAQSISRRDQVLANFSSRTRKAKSPASMSRAQANAVGARTEAFAVQLQRRCDSLMYWGRIPHAAISSRRGTNLLRCPLGNENSRLHDDCRKTHEIAASCLMLLPPIVALSSNMKILTTCIPRGNMLRSPHGHVLSRTRHSLLLYDHHRKQCLPWHSNQHGYKGEGLQKALGNQVSLNP